jgi:glycolate oxidase
VADVAALLGEVVSPEHVLAGDEISDDYAHDEALTATPEMPAFVVRPGSTAEVSDLLRVANEHTIPVTARGSGTGLSGAAVPRAGGMVVSFERMKEIV